jgi:hypothetical protein
MITVGNIVRIKDWQDMAREVGRGSIDLEFADGTKGKFSVADPMIIKDYEYFGDGLCDIQLSPLTHPNVTLKLTSHLQDDFIIDLLEQVRHRINAKHTEKIRA